MIVSVIYRRTIPVAITFVIGAFMVYNQYIAIGKEQLEPLAAEIAAAATIITTFMYFVGSVNLI